ncbi:MAG: DivIVA domain-containing protein [Oscillospiraceae bacterium]|nr:DivIVA domain-containing protein [Oscillospiraceae bacterium]
MITAQDIREKTFEKSTFGGYAMNEVDDFLDELASDLAASQKETATLRSKMKVLVEKIEEYRESEDAMHLALVSAQKVAKNIQDESQAKADELIANAKAEAESILSAAKAEAEAITGDIVRQRETEELRLQKAQAAAADYIQKFRMVLDHETTFLDSLAESDFVQDVIVTPAPEEPKAIPAPADTPEAAAEEAAEAVDDAVENADEKVANYVEAFEKAVFDLGGDDAIPAAEDGDDAPAFRF